MIEIKIPFETRTKKNSSRIIIAGNRRMLIPSKAYLEFENKCKPFLKPLKIDYSINLNCKFYMKTKRKVDLNNLLSAITDTLVKYKVIVDDNKDIIVGFDGSRVLYDPDNPRTEIYIERSK